ncbi:MAG TPA: MBL fold metallo-hydrolase [Thermomicrobiales bacterium]|nr:MBL fold metallo-hydrolase [Thermomicrobiales bacterium]
MKKVLHLVLASIACSLAWSPAVLGADPVPSGDIAKRGLQKRDFPLFKELTPGVYAFTGTLGPLNGTTTITTVSLVVVTTEGVVVVDGQNDVPQTEAMIGLIKKLTPQPIKYVVVASDHGDHVNGNAAFKAAFPDVVFLASPVSQGRLAKTDHPPTQAVEGSRTIRLGNTDIQILSLGRAHTGGDLLAYLPQSKVLFMSEIYLHHVFPALTSGYPTEWTEVIKKAQAMDVSWYVAGHGFIDDAATMKRDLQKSLDALEYVIAEGKRLHAAGEPCESRTNCPAVQKAAWGRYGDLTLREMQAPIALSKVYEEIEGRLP